MNLTSVDKSRVKQKTHNGRQIFFSPTNKNQNKKRGRGGEERGRQKYHDHSFFVFGFINPLGRFDYYQQ